MKVEVEVWKEDCTRLVSEWVEGPWDGPPVAQTDSGIFCVGMLVSSVLHMPVITCQFGAQSWSHDFEYQSIYEEKSHNIYPR